MLLPPPLQLVRVIIILYWDSEQSIWFSYFLYWDASCECSVFSTRSDCRFPVFFLLNCLICHRCRDVSVGFTIGLLNFPMLDQMILLVGGEVLLNIGHSSLFLTTHSSFIHFPTFTKWKQCDSCNVLFWTFLKCRINLFQMLYIMVYRWVDVLPSCIMHPYLWYF